MLGARSPESATTRAAPSRPATSPSPSSVGRRAGGPPTCSSIPNRPRRTTREPDPRTGRRASAVPGWPYGDHRHGGHRLLQHLLPVDGALLTHLAAHARHPRRPDGRRASGSSPSASAPGCRVRRHGRRSSTWSRCQSGRRRIDQASSYVAGFRVHPRRRAGARRGRCPSRPALRGTSPRRRFRRAYSRRHHDASHPRFDVRVPGRSGPLPRTRGPAAATSSPLAMRPRPRGCWARVVGDFAYPCESFQFSRLTRSLIHPSFLLIPG